MSSDSNIYVLQESKRVAMLSEEIEWPVHTTLWKPRRIVQMFGEVLHSPLGYAIKVSEPNYKFRFREWEYNYFTEADLFWKSVKEDIPDVVTYIKQLGMAQKFRTKDIQLLFEAVTKHFLWDSKYLFKEND